MARQAFSGLPSSKKSRSIDRRQRRSNNRANFDVLARAEAATKDNAKIKQHRLGEIDDDDRRPKNVEERSVKRRKLDLPGKEDEEDLIEDGGSDSEGNTWRFGVNGEEEDSDIDSDEALGDSDEDRFQDFKFRGSSSSKARSLGARKPAPRDISLQENESIDVAGVLEDGQAADEYEDDLGEDAVDLATALDMNEQEEKEEERARAKASLRRVSEFSSIIDEVEGESEDSDADPDEETQSSVFSVSDDDIEPGDHSKFLDFVEDLNERSEPSKRRPQSAKAYYMFENPSEFGIKPSKKLTAADLLPTVTDPQLRQSLKLVRAADKEEPRARSGGIPGKLAPPLAKRQQDRLDRAAAYEKSKETLNKWIDTVKQNRRAEHVFFPLPVPDARAALGSKQLLPTTSSNPMTDLESAICGIMAESGLADGNGKSSEEKLREFEELQEKKLPIEEVQARRAELRKARDLMFREEARARRIKKIKSKAYRRVHRKERERAAQEERAALAAAGVLDSEEEQERNDRRRAEERMGARHRESKWAKGLKATGRAAWDEDARSAVNDLARRDDELRRRIEGKRAANSEDEEDVTSGSDSQDDYTTDASEGGESRALRKKLDELDAAGQASDLPSQLNSLKFMQKAEAARKAATDAEINQLRREIGGEADESDSISDEATAGRRSYGYQKHSDSIKLHRLPTKSEFEEPLSDAEEPVHPRSLEMESLQKTHTKPAGRSVRASHREVLPTRRQHPVEGQLATEEDDLADNPWLSGKTKSGKNQGSKDVVVSATALLNAPRTGQIKTENGKVNRSSRSHKVETVLADAADVEDEEPNGHSDLQTRNQELVRQAFAGDNVFEDFTKEKAATMQEEGDQVVNNGLPGWGSWTGQGINKKAQKAQKRNLARFKTTVKGVQEDKRKDAALDRVIINEKKVKKNNRYMASELPHPFESREQYQRSLRLPLGPEWTTKNTFQDATKPRVLLKQGVIRPMEKPMA